MIPFSNQAPFDRDEKTGIWTRKSEDADYQKMYEDCIVLLEELNKRNIDIVVFPEIVMTEQLISDIKAWLMQNRDKAGNLKLLFMGSYYTENINRCVLLSFWQMINKTDLNIRIRRESFIEKNWV